MILTSLGTAVLLMGMAQAASVEESGRAVVVQDEFVLPLGGEGLSFAAFLGIYSDLTGKRCLFDPGPLENRRIAGVGAMSFPAERAERVLETILFANGIVIVDIGAPADRLCMVEDMRRSPALKGRARFVPAEIIESTELDPTEVVTTVVPLVHASCNSAVRVVQGYLVDHQVGFVTPETDANAVVLCNFAHAVKTGVSVLRELDRAAGAEAAVKRREARTPGR